MLAGLPLLRCFAGLVALIAALAAIPAPPGVLPAQAAAGVPSTGSWTREPDTSGWRVGVQFTNYNGDRLSAAFPVARTDVDQATGEFGYTKAEAQAVFTTCKGCDQAEVDRRIADFYRRRGFDLTPTPGFLQLSINMPELVWRNAPRVRAAAVELERIARERHYDASATIGAALSLAQTAIPYFSPPMQDNGRDIFGLYVPPQVLVTGKGDCDSKTGLVASLLKNFSGAKMIGINVPNHYLMAVARVPQRGEAFIDYRGEPYVLLEPAGPGWLPPGSVSEYSLALLGTMRDVRIDPFR